MAIEVNLEQFINPNTAPTLKILGIPLGLDHDQSKVLLRELYGPSFDRLLANANQGIYPKDTSAIENNFKNRLRDICGFLEGAPMDYIIRDLFSAANATVNYVAGVLSDGSQDMPGSLNKIVNMSPVPSERLKTMGNRVTSNGSIKRVDPRLPFEARRQIGLAFVAGFMKARELNYPIIDRLNDIQDTFDLELYSGDVASLEGFSSYAFHDNEDNSFIRFRQTLVQSNPVRIVQEPTPQDMHLKFHHKEFRHVEDVGYVYTNARAKRMEVSIAKALAKAANNGGEVDPLEAVKDSVGIMFVIMGNDYGVEDTSVSNLTNKIEELLKSNYPTFGGFKEDHKVDGGRGQSQNMNFLRYQAAFADLPVPVEIMVYKYPDYLNASFNIGSYNPILRTYDGMAHRIYEHNRARLLIPYLYPNGIYVDEQPRIYNIAEETIKRKAAALLAENRLES